jgi:hypothetical protein
MGVPYQALTNTGHRVLEACPMRQRPGAPDRVAYTPSPGSFPAEKSIAIRWPTRWDVHLFARFLFVQIRYFGLADLLA